MNSQKISSHPEDIMNLCDSPRPDGEVEDLTRVFYADDMGTGDDDDLKDLFAELDIEQSRPSRLGRRREKDLSKYEDLIRNQSNPADPDDEEILDSDEAEEEEDEANDEEEALSVSPLQYAM